MRMALKTCLLAIRLQILSGSRLVNRGVTGVDFVKGLAKEGHQDVAQSILNLLKTKNIRRITYKHRLSLTVTSTLSPRLTIKMTIKVLAQVIVWKVKIGNALKNIPNAIDPRDI